MQNPGIRSPCSTSRAATCCPNFLTTDPLVVALSRCFNASFSNNGHDESPPLRRLDLFVLCLWLFVSGKFLCFLGGDIGERERERAERDVGNWKEKKKKYYGWRVFFKAIRCFIFSHVTRLLKNRRKLDIFKLEVSLTHCLL